MGDFEGREFDQRAKEFLCPQEAELVRPTQRIIKSFISEVKEALKGLVSSIGVTQRLKTGSHKKSQCYVNLPLGREVISVEAPLCLHKILRRALPDRDSLRSKINHDYKRRKSSRRGRDSAYGSETSVSTRGSRSMKVKEGETAPPDAVALEEKTRTQECVNSAMQNINLEQATDRVIDKPVGTDNEKTYFGNQPQNSDLGTMHVELREEVTDTLPLVSVGRFCSMNSSLTEFRESSLKHYHLRRTMSSSKKTIWRRLR